MSNGFEMIYVIPGEPGRVGIAEKHPAHPGGEVYVAGNAADLDAKPVPVLVAMTPQVNMRLGRGFLKRVPAPKSVAKEDSAAREAAEAKGEKVAAEVEEATRAVALKKAARARSG